MSIDNSKYTSRTELSKTELRPRTWLWTKDISELEDYILEKSDKEDDTFDCENQIPFQ